MGREMMKISKCLLSIFLLLILSCEGATTHSERRVIRIEGKPVILTYIYHINTGSLEYSYEGLLDGNVGVCYITDCKRLAEKDFVSTCTRIDRLQGDLSKITPAASHEEEMDAGECRCLVFIPESQTTMGEITIEFKEGPIGSW